MPSIAQGGFEQEFDKIGRLLIGSTAPGFFFEAKDLLELINHDEQIFAPDKILAVETIQQTDRTAPEYPLGDRRLQIIRRLSAGEKAGAARARPDFGSDLLPGRKTATPASPPLVFGIKPLLKSGSRPAGQARFPLPDVPTTATK